MALVIDDFNGTLYVMEVDATVCQIMGKGEIARARAERIVTAVNSHDSLVEALAWALAGVDPMNRGDKWQAAMDLVNGVRA